MKRAKSILMSVSGALFAVCLLLALATTLPSAVAPARRFMASAGVNVFNSASGDYRRTYGGAVLMPELKLTWLAVGNFGVWGSCARVDKRGLVAEVNEPAALGQWFLAAGIGYARGLGRQMRLRGELGLAYVSFREEALGRANTGGALGWRAGACLDHGLGRVLFATLTASYSRIGLDVRGERVDLGGLRAGFGLGAAF